MSLPGRGREAEDAFVAAAAAADPEQLLAWVGEALDARRPQLAARLVGLIPDEVEAGPELDAARRAARFVLVGAAGDAERGFTELERTWSIVRRRRMRRIKERMRRSLEGRTGRPRRR